MLRMKLNLCQTFLFRWVLHYANCVARDLNCVAPETWWDRQLTFERYCNLCLAVPAYLAFFSTQESVSVSELGSTIMCVERGESTLPVSDQHVIMRISIILLKSVWQRYYGNTKWIIFRMTVHKVVTWIKQQFSSPIDFSNKKPEMCEK